MLDRRQFLIEVPTIAGLAARAAAGQNGSVIRRVDIIHHTHTDIGYTDALRVVLDTQKRYIDAAIDACRADPGFRWTVESLVDLDEWWPSASAARRNLLLGLIKSGQIDVMGLPFNQTPFQNAMQWRQMMSWIPESLWRSFNTRAAMQNDVNGFPRAGAISLLDRGINHLLMGINPDNGGPPFRGPTAFWWKMPDRRRLFVWMGEHYGSAMRYLQAAQEEDGNRMRTDEQSVRAAHAGLLQHLRELEAEGYSHKRLILSFTNPLHYDNGSPYPSLSPFIQAWNRLRLEPSLHLVTATEAVFAMEEEVSGRILVKEGEWTDWWANGAASGPREVAASRYGKRYLAAAMSPVWGPMPADAAPAVESILKDLCLFDEHTWGADSSISAPYSLRTLGQYVEKSELAYKPMAMAEWLLTRRSRTRMYPLPEGVYAVNASPTEISGWAVVAADSLSPQSRSLVDSKTGERVELWREGDSSRFWLEGLPPHSFRALRTDASAAANLPSDLKPAVKLDATGWPASASWPGMRKPLFEGSLGEFLCVGLVPPADRRTIATLHATADPEKRAQIRKESLRLSAGTYGEVGFQETPHTCIYNQEMYHLRLAQAHRSVELWKREPRARISVRFDRLSSMEPELFYLAFGLPEGSPLPTFSSGGVPFTPYRDQLPGSCRDYFAIDGWAHYPTTEGHWLWVTRDAPLAVVGGPHALERHQVQAADRHRILAMVFDNCWYTNFVADSHGMMQFQFELAWKREIAKPADLAEALVAEPVVVVNPAVREEPALIEDLYRP